MSDDQSLPAYLTFIYAHKSRRGIKLNVQNIEIKQYECFVWMMNVNGDGLRDQTK
jgi:hypothetical protein